MNTGAALDTRALLLGLRQRGVSLGQPLFYRAQTDSTNDDGLRALRDGQPPGALFIAEEQTRGRGRRGASWWSAPGDDLTFSLLLRPHITAELLPCITLVMGVALHRALGPWLLESAPPLQLKWPNDVLAGGDKLVGILVEAQTSEPDAREGLGLCAGFGINVNSDQLPEDAAPHATSMRRLRGSYTEREPLLVDVLHQIETALGQFERDGMTAFQNELLCHDALRGKALSIGDVSGIGAGIDGRGRLLVRRDGGQVAAVSSGTVVVTAPLS